MLLSCLVWLRQQKRLAEGDKETLVSRQRWLVSSCCGLEDRSVGDCRWSHVGTNSARESVCFWKQWTLPVMPVSIAAGFIGPEIP